MLFTCILGDPTKQSGVKSVLVFEVLVFDVDVVILYFFGGGEFVGLLWIYLGGFVLIC